MQDPSPSESPGGFADAEDQFRLLFERSSNMVASFDATGRCLYVSPACMTILGYTPEELIGSRGTNQIHPADVDKFTGLGARLDADGEVATLVSRAVRKDGSVIWLESTIRAFRDERGEITEIQSSSRNVDERIRTEEQLRRSERLHRAIATNLPGTGLFLLDRDLRVVLSHGNSLNRLPWFADEEFKGRTLEEKQGEVPPEILRLSIETYTAALEGVEGGFAFTQDGLSYSVKAVPVSDDDEGAEVDSVLVVVQDVTERERGAQRLERNAREQRAAASFGQMALRERDLDRLLQLAATTVAETLNVEFSTVLEYDEVSRHFRLRAGRGWNHHQPPISLDGDGQAVFTLGAGAPVVVASYADEDRFTPAPIFSDHGIVSGLSVIVEGRERPYGVLSAHAREPRDFEPCVDFMTAIANVLSAAVERNRDEDASRHAALHDPLTGLPNRVLALDRLEHGLQRRRRDGSDVAVIVLDLDRFKLINDSLGHEAGDELLCALASRLSESIRAEDTIARLSGDEFAVICHGLNGVHDVITIAEGIKAAVAPPFDLPGGTHTVTASLGIALATADSDDPASLLRDADLAMYRAKREGPGRFELFDDEMRARVVNRVRIEADLRLALKRDELRIHYQPIIDLESGETAAVEALVRWQHPQNGLCGPCEFIEVAEESGLIVELGNWVLAHACAQVADWQRLLDRDLGLCVNVSPVQLAGPFVGAAFAEVARASGLREGTLALEITESALISETEAQQDAIRSIGDHGLMLLLDDFGTGYSSLSYLKRFQLDGIKIDRDFIDGLGADENDSAIVEAIVGMARGLSLRLVAEGVETEEQLARLRELGCFRAQGYLFSRPQAASAITEYLKVPVI